MAVPFQRAPRESDKAWTACLDYCRMGRDRSAAELAEKGKHSVSVLRRWSVQWGWVARAMAWEDAEQERVTALWQARRDEVCQADWEMSLKLRAKANDMLAFPIARKTVENDGQTTIIEPAKWTQADTAKIAETASKLARLSAGLATERHEVFKWDPSECSDEELQRIAAGEDPRAVIAERRAGGATTTQPSPEPDTT